MLPFKSLSADSAQRRFGNRIDFADSLAIGIPDAIITRLSGVRQFRVRPTSAVARFHRQAIDVQDVGRSLGSQYVLVGTVRASADRVRVSVQLVRTSDASPIWGGQFDNAREDYSASKMPSPRRYRVHCACKCRMPNASDSTGGTRATSQPTNTI